MHWLATRQELTCAARIDQDQWTSSRVYWGKTCCCARWYESGRKPASTALRKPVGWASYLANQRHAYPPFGAALLSTSNYAPGRLYFCLDFVNFVMTNQTVNTNDQQLTDHCPVRGGINVNHPGVKRRIEILINLTVDWLQMELGSTLHFEWFLQNNIESGN